MKTLKTIGAAFALTLLVSAVSAPAMETVKAPFKWVATKAVDAKNYVATTRAANVVVGAVKATDKALFGNVASIHDDGNNVAGGIPVLRSYLRSHNGFVRAGTVAAIVAAPVVAYKLYSYLTAEEVVAEEASEPVQNVVPAPAEEVTAPVETPAVEAPKAEVKKEKRNPFAKRTVKRTAPAKAKRNAGCANGRCGVRRSK